MFFMWKYVSPWYYHGCLPFPLENPINSNDGSFILLVHTKEYISISIAARHWLSSKSRQAANEIEQDMLFIVGDVWFLDGAGRVISPVDIKTTFIWKLTISQLSLVGRNSYPISRGWLTCSVRRARTAPFFPLSSPDGSQTKERRSPAILRPRVRLDH